MHRIAAEEKAVKQTRVAAIDIFRGLTIFTMIFVNDLAGVRGIPQWMEHMPADVDGMTFVDLVFPAFLFIVGMSIPFAINKRIKVGDTNLKLWKHILTRSAALLVLGVMMVNIGSLNPELTGMSKALWMLLLFIGAILAWNSYPKYEGKRKILFLILKSTGIIILIILAAIYRGGTAANTLWLTPKWWGILGLIGWAYFSASAVFILFRNSLSAITGMFILFILLYIGDKSGNLEILNYINRNFIALGPIVAAHAAIATSGIIFSLLFFQYSGTVKEKIINLLIYTAMLFAGGYFLRPLYGISKIYATPTWILYSAGFCSLIFLFIYWLVDIKGIKKWSNFLKPAGTNPLLAYLLPSIEYALIMLFGITFFSGFLGEGFIGILRSLAIALLITWVTGILTKLNIRLRL